MIQKYIIHLKNIIFFKITIISFIIVLLILLIFMLKQDLDNTTNKYSNINDEVSSKANELNSINSSKNALLDIYQKYEPSLNISIQERCFQRQKLIIEIQRLAEKYNLSAPIMVNVIRSFEEKNNPYAMQREIKINNYNVDVNLTVPDVITGINLIKDIYALTPENGFINFWDVKAIDTIDPKMIAKLDGKSIPNMVTVRVLMYLREISAQRY